MYIFNATHCIVVPIRWKAFSSDSVDLNKAAGHLNIRLHLHQLAFASSSWSKLLACHLSKCRRPQVFSLSRSRTSSSDMNGCIILLSTVVGDLLKAAVTFFYYRNINLVFWRRKLKLSLRAAQSIIKPPNIVLFGQQFNNLLNNHSYNHPIEANCETVIFTWHGFDHLVDTFGGFWSDGKCTVVHYIAQYSLRSWYPVRLKFQRDTIWTTFIFAPLLHVFLSVGSCVVAGSTLCCCHHRTNPAAEISKGKQHRQSVPTKHLDELIREYCK